MAQKCRVFFLLCDGMLATSLTLAAEMLRGAQSAAAAKRLRDTELEIVLTAPTLEPVKTQAGIALTPQVTLVSTNEQDIIYVPALWRNPLPIVNRHPDVLLWLQQAHRNNTAIAGVGSGCFFLAAASLLDDKPATTHWHAFDLFERYFPQANLKRDYFITQTGKLYCAASINSLADLTVHFIQQLYSAEIARHIERHFSHEIRRPYESLRYFEGALDLHSDEAILQAQLWLRDNFQQPVQFSELARQCEMSVRTFNRRFKSATGKSPLQYLQEVRLGVARELLQNSNLSISEIAYRVGYQDVGHFSLLFKKLFAATPHEYRMTVRAKLFSIQ